MTKGWTDQFAASLRASFVRKCRGYESSRRMAASLDTAMLLSGCSSLFDDPRTGTEGVDSCIAHVSELLPPDATYRTYDDVMGVPIFTFDVTKMELADVRTLIVEGSDETLGSRGRVETIRDSTAVDNFMVTEVTDRGAFFLGLDPALYRVRGALQSRDTMIAVGCARQMEDMRLILVEVVPVPPVPEPDPEPDIDPNELDPRGETSAR